MRKFCQTVDLFAMGGGTYGLIEVLWRGYTHWSMALLGGVLFLLIGAGNRLLPEYEGGPQRRGAVRHQGRYAAGAGI